MKQLLFILGILLCLIPVRAQEDYRLELSLDEAIARARTKSVQASVALNRLKAAYWQYRSYRAELLPEVGFTATLPAYVKQYQSYQTADGSYDFVRSHYLNMSGGLSISQNIRATGGTLSLSTQLDYFRQLSDGVGNRFMAVPVALRLDQPLFGVNTVRWDSKIEPVRYAEAKAEFISASEDVASEAIAYFFNLLMAIENLDIARQNLSNAEMLYGVAREKRDMGRISRNDLLQMEANMLEAQSDVTDCESEYKNRMFALRTFLDYEDNVTIVPELPGTVPDVEIPYADALERAMTNNKFSRNIRRRQLEAEYDVAKAKGELREINIRLQVGYNGTGAQFRSAYNPLKDNQVVEVGVSLPILDWGKRRGKVKVAESNRRLTESQLRQETQTFRQDLFIMVERFNNQRRQLNIAQRADTIAVTRYNTNVETYLVGAISTLDLNDSQSRKDQSRRQLLSALALYWQYWYNIRSLTLWDYENNRPIDADIDKYVRQ